MSRGSGGSGIGLAPRDAVPSAVPAAGEAATAGVYGPVVAVGGISSDNAGFGIGPLYDTREIRRRLEARLELCGGNP